MFFYGSVRGRVNFHGPTPIISYPTSYMPEPRVAFKPIEDMQFEQFGDVEECQDENFEWQPHDAAAHEVSSHSQPVPASSQLTTPATIQIASTHFRARGTSDKPPVWLGDQSDSIRNDGRIKKLSVSSQWFATPDEALDQVTRRSEEVVSQTFLEQKDRSLAGLSFGVIEHSTVGDCQLERIIKDFGKGLREPMFRAHVRLNIDTSSGSMLHQHWAARIRYSNLWRLGIATVCLTLCLGAFGQLLRWNRATAGRYRGSLVTGAALAATAAATGAMWLPGWFLGSAL
jgi:hypothetical protein